MNLSADNLTHVIDTGDVNGMMGGGIQRPVSEARVQHEMQTQGMALPPPPTGEVPTTFSEMLRKSVEQVNQDQMEANNSINNLIAGRNKNIHETMLAIEKADTSLKLMMQVRNKVLDAYREVMRMQV